MGGAGESSGDRISLYTGLKTNQAILRHVGHRAVFGLGKFVCINPNLNSELFGVHSYYFKGLEYSFTRWKKFTIIRFGFYPQL